MFKLLIECSKDIDELHINFSDGTSTVVEKSDKKNQKGSEPVESVEPVNSKKSEKIIKDNKEPRKKLDSYLDTDVDYSISQEVVEKPSIPDIERPPKVSDELQNFNF